MALLACKDVSFAYEGNIVVRNINFTVETGDYLCIVGENGSGKSTLIKGILGLLKPCAGEIQFDPGLKATEIGYMPQQIAAQKDFPASVFEVVLSGRLSGLGVIPFYSRGDRQAAMAQMEQLNIAHLKNACYRELSGGQQQRVLLCRALCATKKALLLDEPAAGLDPGATKDLYTLLHKLNKDRKLTVIMVSHDLEAAVYFADKILQLQTKQVYFGKAKDYEKTCCQ